MKILFPDLVFEHQQYLWSTLHHLKFTMVGGTGSIASDDGGGPDPPVPDPATVAAPATGVAAGDPLHNFTDIGAAVAAIANSVPDTGPMIKMFEDMSQELHSLSLEQRATKRENAMLVAASRKAKVADSLSKLSNPMSQRAVTLNFRVLHIIEDIMSVLKPNGSVYVPTNLGRAGAVILAQTVLLEEITRIIQRDSEVHQIAKDSHIGWSLLPFLDEEETAYEERDSSRMITSRDIAKAEKNYTLDKSKTSNFRSGGAGRGVSTSRGRGKGKGKGKGRGKSTLNSVAGGSVGKASKPHTGAGVLIVGI